MSRTVASLALLLAATPAVPGPAELEAAWRDWAKRMESDSSTLAILQDGELIGQWGHGADPAAPFALASLSKAITSSCILALEDEGLLATDWPLSRVFENRADLLDPAATDAGQITLADLMTHTSGLVVDSTQNLMHPAWWGLMDGHDSLTTITLARPLGADFYFYNNENYAVLGSVIQEVTGTSIEQACAPRVLDGLETAQPSPMFFTALAYAGWEMSAADYARFADGLSLASDWPEAEAAHPYYYGPGVDIEYWPEGPYISHSGSYCLAGARTSGSFFAQYPNGMTFVMIHDLCLVGNEYWEMYDLLLDAALQ